MKDAMIVIAKFNQLQNQKLFALLDTLTDPGAEPEKYDIEDYAALKAKVLETDAGYVAGFEAISEEKCVAGPGVPLYDMVMKGMFIANFVRGAICQALKAEYGIPSDLISGALLS